MSKNARKNQVPQVERLEPLKGISIHHVIGTGWVHTHGMDVFGLPELEVRKVPAMFTEAAAKILRHVCRYMLEPQVKVKLGDTMSVSPHVTFRFVSPEPIPECLDHYEHDRWELVGIEPPCSLSSR